MVLPVDLMQSPPAGRREGLPRNRAKAWTQTLGATRDRLVGVLHSLGIYEGRIADRLGRERAEAQAHEVTLRERRRPARLRAERRLDELRSAREAATGAESRRLARRREGELAAHLADRRRFALMLTEQLASGSMTEEQQAADRLEEQIVVWLTADESGT